MTHSELEALTAIITERANPLSAPTRLMVGIAGPPGSGKSTTVDVLEKMLNGAKPGFAAILPMDGFHYDDILLNALGRRARKGAPDTFDVGGFLHLLQRLRHNAEPSIAVPVFDRSIEIARAGARLIPQDVRVILVEGNYLLLDEKPWSSVAPAFDMTVMIETPIDVLDARLRQRWESYNLPPDEVRAKVESNDLPNARYVIAHSMPADHVIHT